MGICSEDRTMLSIDPMAESKSIPGYDSFTDLYTIMEETVRNDSVIYRNIVETESSLLTISEADGARNSKYVDTIAKLNTSIVASLNSYIAKIKSVCAGIKNKLASFRADKLSKTIERYSAEFARNKDLASSSRFVVKYDKKALLCTDKELEQFAIKAGKSAKDLAKNSLNLAKNNAAAINKKGDSIYKVPVLEKYAKDFCCCCGEKGEKVKGNPFTDGFTTKKLEDELKKAAGIDKALDSLCASGVQALEEINKIAGKINSDAQKNPAKVENTDVETILAVGAISTGISKGLIHATSDIVRIYKKHINECVKVYISIAKMKAVKQESGEIEYVGSPVAICEADILAEDFDMMMDI